MATKTLAGAAAPVNFVLGVDGGLVSVREGATTLTYSGLDALRLATVLVMGAWEALAGPAETDRLAAAELAAAKADAGRKRSRAPKPKAAAAAPKAKGKPGRRPKPPATVTPS